MHKRGGLKEASYDEREKHLLWLWFSLTVLSLSTKFL